MTSGSGTTVDKHVLKRRYAEERDKRLRPDGNRQYTRLDDQLGHELEDPYMPVVPRRPRTDHVTFAFIGGGFAGLLTGARLKEAGIGDVRIIDKAGDFGGTWYWNRYPGAQCDTASFVYMPLLEETGHMPTEKYAHGPEILEHCRRIGKQFSLYENALFHTEVTDLSGTRAAPAGSSAPTGATSSPPPTSAWAPARCTWPSCPASPASGRSGATPSTPAAGTTATPAATPTARPWTASPTSGSRSSAPAPPRSSASPTWPGRAGELYVFQRTPSSVDVRDNRPTDPDWFAEVATPGWQQRWLENFPANQSGALPGEDLVQDGWTDSPAACGSGSWPCRPTT